LDAVLLRYRLDSGRWAGRQCRSERPEAALRWAETLTTAGQNQTDFVSEAGLRGVHCDNLAPPLGSERLGSTGLSTMAQPTAPAQGQAQYIYAAAGAMKPGHGVN